MKIEYDNDGQLYDTRYAADPDVRRVQEALRAGGGIENVYYKMGFEHEYAGRIIRYLRYREWHIYDAEIMEFDQWQALGEPRR